MADKYAGGWVRGDRVLFFGGGGAGTSSSDAPI